MATKNGTKGRVYGGDCNLIHVADGKRAAAGQLMARNLDEEMRFRAVKEGRRSIVEASTQQLCPGCYMIVGFNMLVTLADQNGQSHVELADSMIAAFQKFKECEDVNACIEEIIIILDKDAEEEFSPLGGVKDYHINMRD
jgi:hypothetical protein